MTRGRGNPIKVKKIGRRHSRRSSFYYEFFGDWDAIRAGLIRLRDMGPVVIAKNFEAEIPEAIAQYARELIIDNAVPGQGLADYTIERKGHNIVFAHTLFYAEHIEVKGKLNKGPVRRGSFTRSGEFEWWVGPMDVAHPIGGSRLYDIAATLELGYDFGNGRVIPPRPLWAYVRDHAWREVKSKAGRAARKNLPFIKGIFRHGSFGMRI